MQDSGEDAKDTSALRTEYIVVVGSYDIIKVKNIRGLFSREVQELIDEGWSLRGKLKSSTAVLKRHGQLCVYVTLIQNMIRKVPIESNKEPE